MSAATNARTLRRLRADAVARGFCQECRCRPARSGAKSCQVCTDRRVKRHAERKAAGLCECGFRPLPGLKTCADCRATTNARGRRIRAERAALGQCYCGRPAEPQRASCALHLERANEVQKRNHQERYWQAVANGVCTACQSRKAMTGGRMCRGCREKAAVYEREYAARKRTA